MAGHRHRTRRVRAPRYSRAPSRTCPAVPPLGLASDGSLKADPGAPAPTAVPSASAIARREPVAPPGCRFQAFHLFHNPPDSASRASSHLRPQTRGHGERPCNRIPSVGAPHPVALCQTTSFWRYAGEAGAGSPDSHCARGFRPSLAHHEICGTARMYAIALLERAPIGALALAAAGASSSYTVGILSNQQLVERATSACSFRVDCVRSARFTVARRLPEPIWRTCGGRRQVACKSVETEHLATVAVHQPQPSGASRSPADGSPLTGVPSRGHTGLAAVFDARSVAVVGASDVPGSWGSTVLGRLQGQGYTGDIYPISRRLDSVGGLRAYASVSAVPSPVNLAVLIIRPDAVPEAILDCRTAGVAAVIALSTGFAEKDQVGLKLEEDIAEVVDAGDLCFVGPNCIGVADTTSRLNFFFDELPLAGSVAILSQGGGLGLYMAECAKRAGVGVSKFITLGNQLRTNAVDALRYLESDDSTSAVAMYVEGAPRTAANGYMRDLLEAIKRLDVKKPIAVFHPSGGKNGKELAYSHTASLAADGAMFAGAAEQHRLAVVRQPRDAVLLADRMVRSRARQFGRRMGIVASGSEGRYLVELCEREGLLIPALREDDGDRVRRMIPGREQPASNPVDLSGAPNRGGVLVSVLEHLESLGYLDGLIYGVPSKAQLGPIPETELATLAKRYATLGCESKKLLVGIRWLGATLAPLEDALTASGHLVLNGPEEAVRMAAALRFRTV